jgi:hypothetical protein
MTHNRQDESIEIRDSHRRHFCIIDNYVIDDHGATIGPYGLALYLALARHADAHEQSCYPSLATLARETGMSRAKAKRTVHALRDAGLLDIKTRYDAAGDMTSSLYTLRDPAGRVHSTPPVGYTVPHPRVHSTPKQDSLNKTQQQQRDARNAKPVAGGGAPRALPPARRAQEQDSLNKTQQQQRDAQSAKPVAAAAGEMTSREREILERLKMHGVARNAKVRAIARGIADKPNALEAIDEIAAALKRNKRIANVPGALVAALEEHDWNAKPAKAARIVARFEE